MKTTVNIIENKVLGFPKLMIAEDGMIVFFLAKGSGTALVVPEEINNYVGEYSEAWSMSLFKDFRGEIKIEQ